MSRTDRGEAREWLISPIHNKRKDIIIVFDMLVEYYHDLKITLPPEKLYRRLYPTESFSAPKLRLLFSYLLKSLEEWLNWRNWKKDTYATAPYLLKAYRDRNLDKHFIKQLKTQKKSLNESTLRNAEYYWEHFLLERVIYDWETSVTTARSRLFNLQEQENALQMAFMGQKLRQACYMAAHKRMYNAPYEQALLPEILDLATHEPYCNEPSIKVYYHCYLSYTNPNSIEAFSKFKRILFRSFHYFPQKEASDLLLFGINYAIRRLNTEGATYLEETFDLYKKGLEDKLLFDDGWLRPFTFTNILITALRLNKITWVKDFVRQYQNKLEPTTRASYVALSTARIAYAEGDYNTAVKQLHHVDTRDFIHQMAAKILLLKIYFEEDQQSLFSAHIKNTRAFIRRRKNLGYHESNYFNILSLAEQLQKINQYDSIQKENLLQRIKSTDPLTEREWLLKELSKL